MILQYRLVFLKMSYLRNHNEINHIIQCHILDIDGKSSKIGFYQ
jgi:hypothetical protein